MATAKKAVRSKKPAVTTPKNPEWRQRLIAERDELQYRLSKLCDFIRAESKESVFLSLSPANRILLERQQALMKELRDVLDVRIELSGGLK